MPVCSDSHWEHTTHCVGELRGVLMLQQVVHSCYRASHGYMARPIRHARTTGCIA